MPTSQDFYERLSKYPTAMRNRMLLELDNRAVRFRAAFEIGEKALLYYANERKGIDRSLRRKAKHALKRMWDITESTLGRCLGCHQNKRICEHKNCVGCGCPKDGCWV